ncbi:MAG: hypothetical protein MI919_05910 [Holophagales bacterium]|nr:hypothetical protein [Holophagales bacterium]
MKEVPLRHSIFVVAALLFLAGHCFAEDQVPEYEGVYILTKGGDLIQLPRLDGRHCSAMTSNLTYNVLSGKGRKAFRYLPISEVSSIPIIDPWEVKGIYINARDERLERVNQLSVLDHFLQSKRILTGVYRNGCERGDISRRSDFVAYAEWGWARDQLNVKNVSEFVTFFASKHEAMYYTATTADVMSERGDSVPAIGFYVITSRGNYPFLTSLAVNSFLEQALARGFSSFPEGYVALAKRLADSQPSDLTLLPMYLETIGKVEALAAPQVEQ